MRAVRTALIFAQNAVTELRRDLESLQQWPGT
jgi:hypothetical protein